ncbi:hypothetical protein EDC01DRAFT_630311 [Geopyxis carbonaria]|nr:hypothetical protein EDC01DRAFT_630311 [Geopyxis carbonaria]
MSYKLPANTPTTISTDTTASEKSTTKARTKIFLETQSTTTITQAATQVGPVFGLTPEERLERAIRSVYSVNIMGDGLYFFDLILLYIFAPITYYAGLVSMCWFYAKNSTEHFYELRRSKFRPNAYHIFPHKLDLISWRDSSKK